MATQKTFADSFIPDRITFCPDLISPISADDLVIFPTALLSDQYKKELIKKNIPHNPDQFTTLPDFCRRYHDDHGDKTRFISDGQALLIMSTTLERIRYEIPFFFRQGSPSSGTIKDLYALRSIIFQRSIDLRSHPLVSTSEKCRQISLALSAYEESLAENELLDSPALVKWTIDQISSGTESIFGCVRIHRLFDLFPREKSLILAIRDHAETFRYEHLSGKDPGIFSLPDWLRYEELAFIEPTPEFESRSGIFTSAPDKNTDNLVQTRLFASFTEELESIAEEIHALAKAGTPFEDIAIAFPNISSVLSSLREVLDDFGIPYHPYAGEPLIREPVIGFLLLFLSLVTDAYPRESVIHLISSPYFNIRQPDLPPITVAEFDQVVRTAGIEGGHTWDEPLTALKNQPEETEHSRIPIPDETVDAILTWIKGIQKDCDQFAGDHTPGRYRAVFREISKRWMKPEYHTQQPKNDDPAFNREIQAYGQFKGCLTRLLSLFDTGETITLTQFRRFLLYLLEEPVNLTHDCGGVRVLGLRQTVGMKYSCLFLGGLAEGEIPNPSTRLPLMTSNESVQLGGRRLDEAIRGERYYFISTLAAGKKVWLSSSRTRGERKILTSSFFEQVRKGSTSPEWGREIVHSQRRAALRAGKSIRDRGDGICQVDSLTWLPEGQIYGSVANRILVEDWHRTGTPDSVYDGILTDDGEVVTWLSGPKMFHPERIWSTTQLETYADCPFRFFLERVVRVDSLPEVDPTLSPAQRGTLIHDTLCEFYTQWCSNGLCRLTSTVLEEATDLLTRIGTETSRRYRYQSPVWRATVASLMGFDGIPGLYRRFLYHEACDESSLIPDRFEVMIGTGEETSGDETRYVILTSGEGEPVRIQGRIDRVDTTPDGQFAIIDYKTGSQYPNGRRIIEGKALQLPLYLLALEKMHEDDERPCIGIGGSYMEISRKITQTWPLLDPEKKQVAGVSSRTRGTPDFREVMRGSLLAAQRYITGIKSGIFPVTQDTCTTSSYCPYSGICRFDRFRVVEPEDGGGE